MNKQYFLHTGRLVMFIMRRERVRLILWTVGIAVCIASLVAVFPHLYPTSEQRQVIALTMNNPAIVAMIGPIYGGDDYHTGAMSAHQLLLFSAMTTGLLSIFFITRLTRAEEDNGLADIVRASPVGRITPMAAVLLCIGFIHVMIGLCVALALTSLRIPSVTLGGSFLFGAALAASGLFYMGVTSAAAQLIASARGTLGASLGIFIASYLLRAVGDVQAEALSLISPLGLILRAEVYVQNNAWPILITAGFGVILMAFATIMYAARDMGTSIMRFQRTRKRQKHRTVLHSAFAFVWREQRSTIYGWAIGMFVLGATYGAVFHDIDVFFTGGELIQHILIFDETALYTEQFLATLMAILAMLSTIPALSIVLNLLQQEKHGRLPLVIVQGVSRRTVMNSYAAWTVIVACAMQTIAAFGLWLTMTQTASEPFSFLVVLQSALIHVPAIICMTAVGVLCISFLPRHASLAWLYLAFSFFVIYFGPLFTIPTWTEKLVPFGFIPKYPVQQWDAGTGVLLSLAVVGLYWLGVRRYEQRDLL